MAFDPFKPVSGKYGSPMGRHGDSPSNFVDMQPNELTAKHQRGGEGYDKGGAYWGSPANVWAVYYFDEGDESRPVVTYIRAASANDAKRRVINDLGDA